jgi:hypothetical protein
MSRGERIALWTLVGVLVVWLIVLSVVTLGEIAYIRQALQGETATAVGPGPVPTATASGQGESSASGMRTEKFTVGIGGVQVVSDTLVLTVTVRSAGGVGELLYEPPVVTDGRQEYPVDGESLAQARFAFLDLVTKGTATARLVFSPAPAPGARLTLVFNPRQQPDDALTPRVEVPVPMPQ